MLLNANGPIDSEDTDWATKLSPHISDVRSSRSAAVLSFIRVRIVA